VHYEDLTPYAYAPDPRHDSAEPPLNVGWLENGHAFPTGPAPEGLVAALLKRCQAPTNLMRGIHFCDLCERLEPDGYRILWRELTTFERDGKAAHVGNGEIRVVGTSGTVYASPTLIIHYVADHGYLPPADFIEGVLNP
jgi:hypothetical protein